MANKIAIIACSNAGLDYLEYPKDIQIFRSVIHFGSEELYEDFVEMDAKTFYERIAKEPDNVPKTSYVSIGKMIETFEKLEQEGYDEVLVITISSGLSGLYEAVKNIGRETKIKVTAFDSKNIGYIQAYMVLKAHEMAQKGYSTAKIIKYLEQIRDHNQWYFAVDTLKYLVKNGRLSVFSGFVGGLLKIKPLLEIREGKVNTVEKIRTTNKALQRVLEKYFEETKDKNVLTYISHAHSDEAVQYFINEIRKVYPERKIETAYLTPVVGAHTGPKAIGLGYLLLDYVKEV